MSTMLTLVIATAQAPVAEQALEAPTSSTEPSRHRKFDIFEYNLERFGKDATNLEALSGDKTTLISVKDIGKTIKFDSV